MCTPSFMCKFPFSRRVSLRCEDARPRFGGAPAECTRCPAASHPMGIRRRSSSRHVEDLRLTIDCLPVATRKAMLAGVREAERVIVGAYTDDHGGVCPMLAAHRRGGRTSFLSFARAWDRFTRAGRQARVATRRERSILI